MKIRIYATNKMLVVKIFSIMVIAAIVQTLLTQAQELNTEHSFEEEEYPSNRYYGIRLIGTNKKHGKKITFRGMDYYIVPNVTTWSMAKHICQHNHAGELVTVADDTIRGFLAENLGAISYCPDGYWIAGQSLSGKRRDWKWLNGTPIADDVLDNFVSTNLTSPNRTLCLAFGRKYHQDPFYEPLECNAYRPYICIDNTEEENSTHKGWIDLGQYLYKIFLDRVPHRHVDARCFKHHYDAKPAVIKNFNHSQLIGRYLLIGRPSLENAWIGAKWMDNTYSYDPEPELSNISKITNTSRWPPWRRGRIQYTGGCVLLDRHLENMTLFVETYCWRKRPYICYRNNPNYQNPSSDVIIKEHGYRIYYWQRTWDSAESYCRTKYAAYNSYLAEIPSKDEKYEVLYVMGENKSEVNHLWLGGRYDLPGRKGVWTWVHDKSEIRAGVLDWVVNNTYMADVESDNVCLNMDRENHIRSLQYGTTCGVRQYFICYFTKADLLRLQEDERKQRKQRKQRPSRENI